jgi:hypothetical protein
MPEDLAGKLRQIVAADPGPHAHPREPPPRGRHQIARLPNATSMLNRLFIQVHRCALTMAGISSRTAWRPATWR